jgi:phosphatidylserine/phosphatidylglycerophosphate/cardiolipin synthase-like enzyme
MLDAIRDARLYVLLEQYLMSSGLVANRFIDAMTEAVARGVRVYVQLDHFGVRHLAESDRERMRKAGIRLAFYNPAYFPPIRRDLPRNHRKLLVVDGRLAFTGGYCISDEYDPKPDSIQPAWHDTMIRIEGPVVADWQALFVENWQDVTGQAPELPEVAKPPAAGIQTGLVTTSRPRGRKGLKRMFIRHVRHSRNRAWIATAYFVPSRKILHMLRRAASRGVDVRLLLPGPINDHPAVRYAGGRYYRKLLRQGIRIYEYQPRFMHAKVFLCDDWASVGSCNMDRWNLHWNLEANQEVLDAGFAASVAAFFEADFRQSHEITLSEWLRRPWHERLREWLWGYVSLWLERFSVLHRMKRDRV